MAFRINSELFDLWTEYVIRRNKVAIIKSSMSRGEWTRMPWRDKLLDIYEGDGIMYGFKFMHIWREQDANSREELRRIALADTFEERLRIIFLNRLVLHWPTFDSVVYRDGKGGFVGDAIQDPFRGTSPFENREIIEAYYHRSLTKTHLHSLLEDGPTLAYKFIRDVFPILGEFRPYEIVTSCCYLKELCWCENDFPFVGHGAKPILYRMYDLVSSDFPEDTIPWEEYLIDFQTRSLDRLQSRQRDWTWIPLEDQAGLLHPQKWTLRTAEDSLCEFRKWIQLRERNVSQRRREYSPENS